MKFCGHYFKIFNPDYSNTFTENFVEMPNGWQACDGSIIEEGIWTGQPTPDLTTDKRFLRGGTMEDVLMFVFVASTSDYKPNFFVLIFVVVIQKEKRPLAFYEKKGPDAF